MLANRPYRLSAGMDVSHLTVVKYYLHFRQPEYMSVIYYRSCVSWIAVNNQNRPSCAEFIVLYTQNIIHSNEC
jgi:hypothetical protein